MIKRLLTTRAVGAIGTAMIAAATLTDPKLAAPDAKGQRRCPVRTGRALRR